MSEEVADILQRPTYMEILLCIVSGKNYATSIAKTLEKKQPTVTEQLKKLEKVNIIRPIKREKSLEYKVNWSLLLDEFYSIINEVMDARKEFLHDVNKIKKYGLKKIVPPSLFRTFLMEYSSTILELGGKKKGFGEIVFSFFAAINNLEKERWKRLIEIFKVDEKSLSFLANLMATELIIIEQTALETYLDTIKGEDNGKSLSKRKNS
jgi:DNA-binding transcriptional ArsR family regulator